MHHRTIQINHQPDATIFQLIILTFIYSSACRIDHEHSTTVTTIRRQKPEAATAVIELLMMGGKTPETCWAVNKRRDNKLKNCCIWLVIYLNWIWRVPCYFLCPMSNIHPIKPFSSILILSSSLKWKLNYQTKTQVCHRNNHHQRRAKMFSAAAFMY